MTNHLYYGDNLAVLRDSIATGSVDLVYLDPPFNSSASYNVLFKGPSGNHSVAQTEAAAAEVFAMEDFASVPRLQIVTIEEALAHRDRAVKLPARRDDAFKRAAREEVPARQGRLDL